MIALALRIVWQMYPCIWTCLLFWAAAIGMCFFGENKLHHYISMFGACLNAVVTIANGGFMPANNTGIPISVWVPLQPHHHFQFLADILPYGFSIGDMFIIAGLFTALGQFVYRYLTN